MPEKYKAMLKWIYQSGGSTTSNEIKLKFIENFGQIGTTMVFDRAITSFLKYCESINILSQTGKGKGRKVELMELGKKILENPNLQTSNTEEGGRMARIKFIRS